MNGGGGADNTVRFTPGQSHVTSIHRVHVCPEWDIGILPAR